jgi:hypothetical protein
VAQQRLERATEERQAAEAEAEAQRAAREQQARAAAGVMPE